MIKSKIFKIIVSLLIAITLLTVFSQNAFAMQSDISKKFIGTKDNSDATNTVGEIIGKIFNFAQIFAMGFAIIMLVTIGIKWMYASPSGKADIAKTSKYYILGAVIIFGGIGFIRIIEMFTKNSFGNIK